MFLTWDSFARCMRTLGSCRKVRVRLGDGCATAIAADICSQAAAAAAMQFGGALPLELAHDTLTDGNCGLHAFAISLLDGGKRYAALYNTSAFKKFHKYRRDPSAMVAYLRDLAMTWLLAHGDDEVWDNLTVRQLAISMGAFTGRFADYVEHMRQDKIWIDALVLHALACMFKVDLAVWQPGMDQTLVGAPTLAA